MIVITEHGIALDYAQIACVSDDDVSKIIEKPCLLYDFDFIMSVVDKKGDNAVIIRLELTRRRDILMYVGELLKTFRTVTWVRNGKVFTRRRQ